MSGDTEAPAGAERPGAQASAADRPALDTSVAHSARVHDYWLGGKHNFKADRVAGSYLAMRANRASWPAGIRSGMWGGVPRNP
jgi:hypothetical protein